MTATFEPKAYALPLLAIQHPDATATRDTVRRARTDISNWLAGLLPLLDDEHLTDAWSVNPVSGNVVVIRDGISAEVEPGDYVVRYPNGTVGIVEADEFESMTIKREDQSDD